MFNFKSIEVLNCIIYYCQTYLSKQARTILGRMVQEVSIMNFGYGFA